MPSALCELCRLNRALLKKPSRLTAGVISARQALCHYQRRPLEAPCLDEDCILFQPEDLRQLIRITYYLWLDP
jgi:hypothetical protein